jgi:hypothetical protein
MSTLSDCKKVRKSTPFNLHVSLMLSRTRYSLIPLAVPDAPIVMRKFANALTACSALLLFQGTPS